MRGLFYISDHRLLRCPRVRSRTLLGFRQSLPRITTSRAALIAFLFSISWNCFCANAAEINNGVQVYTLKKTSDVKSWSHQNTDAELEEMWDIDRPANLNNGVNDDSVRTPPDENDIVIIPENLEVRVVGEAEAYEVQVSKGGFLHIINKLRTTNLKVTGGTGKNDQTIVYIDDFASLNVDKAELKEAELDIMENSSFNSVSLSLLNESYINKKATAKLNVQDVIIDKSLAEGLRDSLKRIFGRGTMIEWVEVQEMTDPSALDSGSIGSLIFGSLVYTPNSRALFDISGLSAGTSYDQIISSHLDYGGNELVLNIQQGPFMYSSDSFFHLFQSDVYSSSPSMVSLLAQGTSYDGLGFMRTSENTYRTDRTPYNQLLLFQSDTGTLSVKEVPGPLPILGLGFFASYTRRLRKLSSRLKSMEKNAENV
jgi:hypothetical protein